MTTITGALMPDAATSRDDLIAAVEALMALARSLDTDAEDAKLRAIAGGRAMGMTWEQIGVRFGTTGAGIRSAYERGLARAARRDG